MSGDNVIIISEEDYEAGRYPPPPEGFDWHLCDRLERPILFFVPTEEPAFVQLACGHFLDGLDGEWDG